MKRVLLMVLVMACLTAAGQYGAVNFAAIDREVQNLDAPDADSLARVISKRYSTDIEKLRAIFTWVATKLAYNTNMYKRQPQKIALPELPPDTLSIWKEADEMVADRVFQRRVAVCDGYARLFKTLCVYVGIPCELVLGYVNPGGGRAGERFRTNHTWNAVFVNSAWRLVDVTWASGYINAYNDFVPRFDDFYFLTPPHLFIRDHFPEEPRWSLLHNPPALPEFRHSPFKAKAFAKYGIRAVHPGQGLIEASLGDTLRFEVEVHDLNKAKAIATSNYADSLAEAGPGFVALEPEGEEGNRIRYRYVLASPYVSWVQLIYNKDVILQYRLNFNASVLKHLP